LKNSTSYLHHILDETKYLLEVSAGVDLAAFQADETLKRAVVRSLEIIGEAVKNSPTTSRRRIPGLSGAEWPRLGTV
jgi:uncharacterized protein with HEPN domain